MSNMVGQSLSVAISTSLFSDKTYTLSFVFLKFSCSEDPCSTSCRIVQVVE